MEVICSAIMGELVSRSISFLVDKYLKQTTAPTEEESLHSLQRLLLRLCIIIEEAEERRITNQAMLHQLCILKTEMYRGYYILDSFSCRAHGEERMNDHQVSHSFAPSKFNPAKRVCFCSGSSQSASQAEQLGQVLGSIGNTIEDVSEFVIFLNRCPRLYRQPYNMYLLLDKCMFGRQMELEYIINFLLQAETTLVAENPGVLPIIGPGKVGKSTLIEHACNDERVRSHFSKILCFGGDDLRDAGAVTLRDARIIKHQDLTMGSGRTLIIIELVLDIDERVWKRLFSSAKRSIASGSKVIIASRSDKIASFGTTQALRVQSLTQEAYWYFFKVRIFGCMNVRDHPKLAAIAMDIAREMNGCFMGATVFRGLLKSNFNPHFWSMALACLRKFKRHNMLVYGERFIAPWQIEEPIYVRRLEKTSSEYIVILEDYQTDSAKSSANSPTSSGQSEPEAPKMSVQDLFFGSVRPQGKFNVLAWTSHLPPHYNYMFTLFALAKSVAQLRSLNWSSFFLENAGGNGVWDRVWPAARRGRRAWPSRRERRDSRARTPRPVVGQLQPRQLPIPVAPPPSPTHPSAPAVDFWLLLPGWVQSGSVERLEEEEGFVGRRVFEAHLEPDDARPFGKPNACYY